MILLLHTSTDTAFLGVAEGGHLRTQETFSMSRDLATTLADRIRIFLEREHVSLGDIRKIVVHTGPGSFTSLRLGVTTANALAYALGVPILGVAGPLTNLEALLERSHEEARPSNIAVPFYERGPTLGPTSSPLPPL